MIVEIVLPHALRVDSSDQGKGSFQGLLEEGDEYARFEIAYVVETRRKYPFCL